MKIAIIAPTQIPARRANTLQVMKMAQALVDIGHYVRLASPCDRSQRRDSDPPETDLDLLAHHYGLKSRLDIDWIDSRPQFRRYDYAFRSVSWARSWQADLLFTRLPQAAAIASLLGTPTILEIHDRPQGMFGPWLFRRFMNGSGARRLVVITAALAEDLSRQFRIELIAPFTVIVPDGVDLNRYEDIPAPEEARARLSKLAVPEAIAGLEPERFTVGYTGHLYPGRGVELILELAKRLPEVDFLIVGGDPPQVDAFQAEADTHGLKNLILTGFMPNADLPLYQAACEVLLMPYQKKVEASSGGDISRYLSPMKLFEYLACKRAIISSDLVVLQEVLNPRNAMLVSADHPQAWEDAIRTLQNDPDLRRRLAEQAHKDANLYTWEARAEKITRGL
jgi:glycosyltransferase involved in cell wall biosynthesis